MSEDNDGIGLTTMLAWMLGALFVFGGVGSCAKSCADGDEYRPTTPTPHRPPITREERITREARSPSSYWTTSSNGHSWSRATYAQKKWICDTMASVSNKGGTSAYYMNFYNSFYGSTATDSTSMDDASKLAEVGL
jgi:hypothetical protein